jgi:uncharacterized protein YndB with AHSA1/START domain
MGESFSLRLEKVISGPIEEVFDAWLDPASLSRWMTPTPGGGAKADTDPVVGGKFRIVMKSDQRQISASRGIARHPAAGEARVLLE